MAKASTPPAQHVHHPRIAIVVSRYNATVTDRLLSGAVKQHQQAGGVAGDLYIAEAPGAFELVAISDAAARSGSFDGVLALGCIVRGETRHDEFLAHAVTQGLANIALTTGIPVSLGVLTVNNGRQALDRAGGRHGNKGQEAMAALLQTVAEIAIIADRNQLAEAMAGGSTLRRVMTGPASPDKLAARSKQGRARPASGGGSGGGGGAGGTR